MRLAELRRQRAAAFDAFATLANQEQLSEAEQADYTARERAVTELDDQITRTQRALDLAAATAQPVAGQGAPAPAFAGAGSVPAAPERDPYLNDQAAIDRGLRTRKGLVIGGMMRMVGRAQQSFANPRDVAVQQYGERHPVTEAVTRALVASIGASGGFIVPPDYVAEIIELLRPRAVVRGAGPRVIPMPRGTMTLPGQASPATATYGTETAKIASSQQTLDQIVASYKKLTALVPVGNDLMRYADPAVDAFVRDDLVKVIALREDLAFLIGDGTQGTPRGFLSFANAWAAAQGGTVGNFSSTGNSTLAANGTAGSVLQGLNGGNWITSNETYTLATAASELGGLVNKLDSANVPEDKRVWFFHPRSFNYLNNVQNSLGVYVYREELANGTLLSYPFRKSTQIPTNIHDATSTNNDCSFIFLAEMDEVMILDSMSLELAVSREGTYIDANSNTVSAFQYDQTLIRAIAEHDFQLRHDSAVAIAQTVRWAPAIS